jgi:hypothetical protein
MDKPDLSNCHILIASPIMDGRVDFLYYNSLMRTKELLEALGAKVQTLATKYCADVYLARERLFGAFLRMEGATHMLSIDSDMGWDEKDVVTMILLKRDFLAAVGPKKLYPITFAYNNSDDNFKQLPLVHEIMENGNIVAEVSEVGGAFVLLTKECCQKLADAHPELQYHGDENVIEYGICDPLYIRSDDGKIIRRLSEDYAFCYRWRKLGGKVEILLDVTLQHVGNHTFTGNLLDCCLQQDPNFNKVEDGKEEK